MARRPGGSGPLGTLFLNHKGSHESQDVDEQVQQALERIEERLGRIASARLPALDGARSREAVNS